MSFFSKEERGEFLGNRFEWQDGKTYNLSIEKVIEESFATGKKDCILKCTDIDTGEVFDRKFEFSLMNALDKLGGAYVDKNTILKVTPKYLGKFPSKKDPSKEYDRYDFTVEAVGGPAPAEDNIRDVLGLDK